MLQLALALAGIALVPTVVSAPQAMAAPEDERIRSHLALVESLLRSRAVDGNEAARRARARGLDALHAYVERGIFPRNHERPGRAPVFVDDDGVACAVGFIMIDSGRADLAEQIHATQNGRWLDEMDVPALSMWVASSGFTSDELRLIQPSYEYSPRFAYAAYEAAYRCEQKQFFDELAKAGVRRGSAAEKAKLNAALRIVAPVANWDKEERARQAEQQAAGRAADMGVYYAPAPRTQNGIPFVRELLKRGANPNDTSIDVDEHDENSGMADIPANVSGRRPPPAPSTQSATMLTKDPEVRAILVAAGGHLTLDDRLVEAITTGDRAAAQRLLASKKGRPASSVICEAYRYAGGRPSPQLAILNDLIASSRFDLNAPCPFEEDMRRWTTPTSRRRCSPTASSRRRSEASMRWPRPSRGCMRATLSRRPPRPHARAWKQHFCVTRLVLGRRRRSRSP